MSIMNLFNGGGSVRSERGPRGDQVAGFGPQGGRPSLPAPTPAPTWDTEREYNKFQTRANEPGARLAEQWAFDMNRERDQWPWTLDVTREGQPRGQHKREGQWKVKSSNFRPRAMLPANEGIGSNREYQSAANFGDYLAQPGMPGNLGSINFQIDMYNDLYNDAIKGGNQGDAIHYLDSIQHLMRQLPRAARGGLMSLNGGGSVRSQSKDRQRPNIGHDRAGPTRVERILQDDTVRSGPDLSWADELDILRGLQQGPGVIDRTIRDRTPPGEGVIKPRNPALPPWGYDNNIGEGSFWNVGLQSRDNAGIMAGMTDTSPDFQGNWLVNNKFGNMFGNFMLGRHGDKLPPDSREILEEAFGQDGGISAFGGKLRPIIGDGRWGFNWSIGGD